MLECTGLVSCPRGIRLKQGSGDGDVIRLGSETQPAFHCVIIKLHREREFPGEMVITKGNKGASPPRGGRKVEAVGVEVEVEVNVVEGVEIEVKVEVEVKVVVVVKVEACSSVLQKYLE